jgi:hypothetical protein
MGIGAAPEDYQRKAAPSSCTEPLERIAGRGVKVKGHRSASRLLACRAETETMILARDSPQEFASANLMRRNLTEGQRVYLRDKRVRLSHPPPKSTETAGFNCGRVDELAMSPVLKTGVSFERATGGSIPSPSANTPKLADFQQVYPGA